MKIIICGCLIDEMKRPDALVTTQKTPTLKTVPLLKKSEKPPKTVILEKNAIFSGFS